MYYVYQNENDIINSRFFWKVTKKLYKYQKYLNKEDLAQSFNENDCINVLLRDCLNEILEECLSYLNYVDENIDNPGNLEQAKD